MVGRKNNNLFVRFLGINEKTHESIHDLLVSLVASECVISILILSALPNDSF